VELFRGLRLCVQGTMAGPLKDRAGIRGMFTMRTTPNKSEAEPVASKRAHTKPADISSAWIPDTLAAPNMNSETGLTHAEMDNHRATIRAGAVIGLLRGLLAMGYP